MTRVTRIMFDVSDIKAVRVRCSECPMTIVLPPEVSYNKLPRNCLGCGNQWESSFSDKRSPEEHFLMRLEEVLIARQPNKRSITIGFEVDSD